MVAVLPEQHRSEERAQRGGDAERFDVDRVGDHRQRHGDQGKTDDAWGGREHTVEPRRRPDAQVDDPRSGPDQRRAVGAVAWLQPPAEAADQNARDDAAEAAQRRRDPVAVERELEQIARREQQRDDADAEKHALPHPALGVERGGLGGGAGGGCGSRPRRRGAHGGRWHGPGRGGGEPSRAAVSPETEATAGAAGAAGEAAAGGGTGAETGGETGRAGGGTGCRATPPAASCRTSVSSTAMRCSRRSSRSSVLTIG